MGERRKEASLVCVKVMVHGKGGDEITLNGVVYVMKSKGRLITKPWEDTRTRKYYHV